MKIDYYYLPVAKSEVKNFCILFSTLKKENLGKIEAARDTQHEKCMTLIRKESIKFQKSNKARF